MINPTILITTGLTNQYVNTNSAVTFYAAATGPGSLHYTWQKNSVAIADGPMNSGDPESYTISSVQTSDAGTYSFVVTNNLGDAAAITSAQLFANVSPTIATIPNQTVTLGSSFAFAVPATDDYSTNGIFQTFESSAAGATATFQSPSYSGVTSPLYVEFASARAYVTNNNIPLGNPRLGTKALYATLNFTNTTTAGWDRMTTITFNPIVSFTTPLKFDIWSDRPMGVCVGVRETNPTGDIGANGGTTGSSIEWVGVSGNAFAIPVPIFQTVASTWTTWTIRHVHGLRRSLYLQLQPR